MFQPEFAARAVESRRGRWHQRIAEGAGPILLAELDDRPLALSFCMPSSPLVGLAEIYSFYGHPEGWGSGVAAALMAETLRNLHRNGYADVHLWTLKSTAQSRRSTLNAALPSLVPNGRMTLVMADPSSNSNIDDLLSRGRRRRN